MTSTQLLIAQVAILALLFGTVIWIVRSSARQIRNATPPPLALDDPVDPQPAPVIARTTSPPPSPAPVAAPLPPAIPLPDADPDGDDMARERASYDFDANLRPRLVVESGPGLTPGTELPLEGGFSIGRAGANGLTVDDTFMSHMHARVFKRGAFFWVEDLGSTNGTFINDQRISGDAQLRVRDQLRLGETVLRYEE
jgi:hypothetical protein